MIVNIFRLTWCLSRTAWSTAAQLFVRCGGRNESTGTTYCYRTAQIFSTRRNQSRTYITRERQTSYHRSVECSRTNGLVRKPVYPAPGSARAWSYRMPFDSCAEKGPTFYFQLPIWHSLLTRSPSKHTYCLLCAGKLCSFSSRSSKGHGHLYSL